LEMTTHQALIAIESFGFIGAYAFGVAASTMTAQKLGAKDPQQAEDAVRFSAKLGSIFLSGFGLILILFSHLLISLFSSDPQVITLGAQCMYVAAFAQPLMALTDVYAGALRGAGDTKTPMKVALVGPLLVRPILCYVLCFPLGLGLLGIWIGSTGDWIIRTIWLIKAFRKGDWKRISV